MDFNDPQVQVSFLSLVTAFIAIMISVYEKIFRNIPKLKVKISVVNEFDTADITNTIEVKISLKITNVGHVTRDIEAPYIQFSRFTYNNQKGYYFSVPTLHLNFPQEVRPGKRLNYPFKVNKILDIIGNRKIKNESIRIIIIDTYGKKYNSNKVMVSEIMEKVNNLDSFKELMIEEQ